MKKKTFDIIARLQQANQRPKIKLFDDLEVSVNTTASGVLLFSSFTKKIDDEDNEDKPEAMLHNIYSALTIAIGESAVERIKQENFTMDALMLLITTVGNAMTGEEQTEEKDEVPSVTA